MQKVLAALAIVAVLAVSSLAWAQTRPADDAVVTLNATGTNGGSSDGGQNQASQPAGGGGSFPYPMIIMAGLLFVMLFWMSRGKNKEAKKRQEMLANLKKGDKITTIGGIVGTVIEVRPDEVMVKVDESSNARMRFARWAIRGVGEESKAETPGKPDDKK
jgi:preprotein translocase subunit YajC